MRTSLRSRRAPGETIFELRGSFLHSYRCALGHLVELNQRFECDLARILLRLERERTVRHLRVRLPIPDPQGVLRCTGHRLAGEHIFPGNRLGARLDPDLPVNFRTASCEVFAFHAVDDATADV